MYEQCRSDPEPGWHLSLMFEAMETRRPPGRCTCMGENPARLRGRRHPAGPPSSSPVSTPSSCRTSTSPATAELADVVLPAAVGMGRVRGHGHVVANGGCSGCGPPSTPPGPGVRTDIDILCDLADCHGGHDLGQAAIREAAWDELRSAVAGPPAAWRGTGLEADGAASSGRALTSNHPGSAVPPRLVVGARPRWTLRRRRSTVVHHAGPVEGGSDRRVSRCGSPRAGSLDSYNTGVQTGRFASSHRSAAATSIEMHPGRRRTTRRWASATGR